LLVLLGLGLRPRRVEGKHGRGRARVAAADRRRQVGIRSAIGALIVVVLVARVVFGLQRIARLGRLTGKRRSARRRLRFSLDAAIFAAGLVVVPVERVRGLLSTVLVAVR